MKMFRFCGSIKWGFCALQWCKTSVNGRRLTAHARPEVSSSLSMRCTAGCASTGVWIAVTVTSAVQRAYRATWSAAVLAVAPVSSVYLTSTWTRCPHPARLISRLTWNCRITVSKVSGWQGTTPFVDKSQSRPVTWVPVAFSPILCSQKIYLLTLFQRLFQQYRERTSNLSKPHPQRFTIIVI